MKTAILILAFAIFVFFAWATVKGIKDKIDDDLTF
jgi:4-hydroxybenzoate polyprenyltransferase